MDGTRFDPEVLTVRPGDTVVWVNRDPVPHTATARSGAFDSGSVEPGKSWKYRAGKPGSFPYFCAFHPTMKGVLKVE
jgi:plastocyanin